MKAQRVLVLGAIALPACSIFFAPSDDAASGSPSTTNEAAAPPPSNDGGGDAAAVCRDCGALACVNGACEVRVLARGEPAPAGLISDGKSATWVNRIASGSVSTMALVGSDSPTVLASEQPFPYAVAYWLGTVVWTNRDDGSFRRLTQADGASQVLYGITSATAVAVGESGAFVVGAGAGRGYIATCNTYAQCSPLWPQYGAESAPIEHIRVAGNSLYYQLATSEMRTCVIGACTTGNSDVVARTITSDPDGVADFDVAEDGSIVWARRGGAGGLRHFVEANGGGTAIDLAPDQAITSVTVKGADVYFTSRGTGRVARVPLAGGEVTTLAAAPAPDSHPTSVVVAGPYVLWIDERDGSIRFTAK